MGIINPGKEQKVSRNCKVHGQKEQKHSSKIAKTEPSCILELIYLITFTGTEGRVEMAVDLVLDTFHCYLLLP